jgi:signal transduction histidine kinase
MNKFWQTRNWSVYSRTLAPDGEAYYNHRRIILFSQFTLMGGIIGFFHALEDLIDGLLFLPLMDASMATGILISYFLNERGKHRAAKWFLLSFLNIFFFVYCSLTPTELGIFLYYFPWIALAAVVFEVNENRERFFFIGLSIALLIVLFVTRFDAFGAFDFSATDLGKSFMINLITAIIVIVFFILFMVRMNENSENRLHDASIELRAKNTALEKTNLELDRFLYSTSHDLRAPLMSVKGLISLAQTEKLTPETEKYLRMMDERVDRLDGFIRDIIDFARNGRTEISVESVQVNNLVNEVFDNLRFMDSTMPIALHNKIPENIVIRSDAGRLHVVLNNLVSNAIKYRHPEGSAWVKVSAEQTDDQVIIAVSDNGRGIAAAHLPRVFDMFYRATDHSKGSGLGLYIVKETLEKLNGSISLHSEVDKGSAFTLSLPRNLILPSPMSEYPETPPVESMKHAAPEEEGTTTPAGVR